MDQCHREELRKQSQTEPNTLLSTLGSRCASHRASLASRTDLNMELQMMRRLILRSIIRTSYWFVAEDAPRILNTCTSSSASKCNSPRASRDAPDRTRAGNTLIGSANTRNSIQLRVQCCVATGATLTLMSLHQHHQ